MLKEVIISTGLFISVLSPIQVIASGDAEAGKAKAAFCGACHGADGVSTNPVNPSLVGKAPGYISAQLKAFKSGQRIGTVMGAMVASLSDQDMDDLDAFYVSLSAKTESDVKTNEKTSSQLADDAKAL